MKMHIALPLCVAVGHGERRGSVRPRGATGLGLHGFPKRDQTGESQLHVKLTSFPADSVQPAGTGLHCGAQCKYFMHQLLQKLNCTKKYLWNSNSRQSIHFII